MNNPGKGHFSVRGLRKGQTSLSVVYGQLVANGKYIVDGSGSEVKIRLQPAPDPQKANAAAEAARANPVKPLAIGEVAPEWNVETWSDGKSRTLAQYRGKLVFLDFWGTWCSPCVSSLPVLAKLRGKYEPRGVIFISIHTPGDEASEIQKLLTFKKVDIPFTIDQPVGTDTMSKNGVTADRYHIRGYPTILMIDGAGKIAFSTEDPGNRPAFLAIMKEMGIDPKTIKEEQFLLMIERHLDQTLDRLSSAR